MIMIGDLADNYCKWLFITIHDDYRSWLVIKIDLWWLLIDYDEEWLWLLIMMIESLRWLVHGDYGWRLIDDGWLRLWWIITENDLSLFMMIIIDDLHNYFNFHNYPSVPKNKSCALNANFLDISMLNVPIKRNLQNLLKLKMMKSCVFWEKSVPWAI